MRKYPERSEQGHASLARSTASVNVASLGGFSVHALVNVFTVSADVLKGGRSAARTKTFRLAREVFPE